MVRSVLITIFVTMLLLPSVVAPQDLNFKQLAKEEFKKANYPKAIEYLNKALIESPDDPEVFYYLGYFTHYLCYDSIPLPGYNLGKSDEVIEFLNRAVELKADYGNALYFLGAEYGARARVHLLEENLSLAITEFKRGKESGGYPDWLLEYGRNILKSCREDAILFLGGDATVNAVQYLQYVNGFRRDVTAIPLALLNRPWFIKMAKKGIKGYFAPLPISWSEYQIMNMHPYKWKTNRISVRIPSRLKSEYNIEDDYFGWELAPDLSEKNISTGAAALADIIKTNRWKRPLYFSTCCGRFYGLKENFQLCGLTFKLVPVKAEGPWGFGIDPEVTDCVMLNRNNYKDLPTIIDHDMPRASAILNNYRVSLISLARYYLEAGRKTKAKETLDFMEDVLLEKYVPAGVFEEIIDSCRKELQ